jgi:hypothetical protein
MVEVGEVVDFVTRDQFFSRSVYSLLFIFTPTSSVHPMIHGSCVMVGKTEPLSPSPTTLQPDYNDRHTK